MAQQPPTNAAGPPVPHLSTLVEEYALLTSIARNIYPSDLLNLAITCRRFNALIMTPTAPNANHLFNFTLICNGAGAAIRKRIHSPPPPNLVIFQRPTCGIRNPNVHYEKCVSCKRIVCEECRTHLRYRNFIRDPMTNVLEFSHIFVYPRAWISMVDFRAGTGNPGGVVVAAAAAAAIAANAATPNLLAPWANAEDPSLGLYQHGFTTDFALDRAAHKSLHYRDANLGILDHVLTPAMYARLVFYCKKCEQEGGDDIMDPVVGDCDCTLHSRYGERWLCLECCLEEQEGYRDYAVRCNVTEGRPGSCGCGAVFAAREIYMIVCSWCKGRVRG